MTDSAAADAAATESWSRRALVGAGVLGAVLVGANARPASASTGPGLSDADKALARLVIGVELAARDLYQAVTSDSQAWGLLAGQHESYAQRLAGVTGISANRRSDALYDQRLPGFAGERPANAAFDLENTLIATHAELAGQVVDSDIADVLASIAAMESHHAAYFAERSGRGDNFEALFHNSASPLTLTVPQ